MIRATATILTPSGLVLAEGSVLADDAMAMAAAPDLKLVPRAWSSTGIDLYASWGLQRRLINVPYALPHKPRLISPQQRYLPDQMRASLNIGVCSGPNASVQTT